MFNCPYNIRGQMGGTIDIDFSLHGQFIHQMSLEQHEGE